MIFILTGAGISKESGLDTFRDAGGLWSRYGMDEVATPRAFRRNPDLVFEFHNTLRRALTEGNAQPNAAHYALARLEAEAAEPVVVVTQNIDDLHEKAGSRALLHMHGELLKARCGACRAVSSWTSDLGGADVCPACGRVGSLRPHVVWFEEMPLYMDEIEDYLSQCRLFASIGTSGQVMPAAGFARHAARQGAFTVELNLEPSGASFHGGRYGPASKVVPAWVDEILNKPG